MKKKPNADIRAACIATGIYQYEVAAKLGVSYTYFNRILQKELKEEEKAKILKIIENLSEE